MVASGFIERAFKTPIIYPEWLLAAAPWSIAMSVLLYFVMMKLMPPETEEVPGGAQAIGKALAERGPVKPAEWRLLAVWLALLALWSTEKIVHTFDTSTTTVAAIALLFLPGIGVMVWKQAQPQAPWGTIVLFGTGISLGTALLQTKAAAWLANGVV